MYRSEDRSPCTFLDTCGWVVTVYLYMAVVLLRRLEKSEAVYGHSRPTMGLDSAFFNPSTDSPLHALFDSECLSLDGLFFPSIENL